MNDAIKEKYRSIPKEYYGATSSNRFSYQRFWGVLQAFKLYNTTDDFYVVFEGAEDIDIVTDSIHFYQVKTNKTQVHYTFSLMKKRSEGSTKSPLMKLAEKERMDGVASLNIVSNLPFEDTYRKEGIDYNKETLNFKEFNDDFSSLVTDYIAKNNGFTPNISRYNFVHSSLSIDDTRSAMVGHAVDFFHGYGAPGETIRMFLDLIMSDVEAMMNKEECDDHLSDKALSKSMMDRYLNRFSTTRNTLAKECAEIIDQFPVHIKSEINRCFTKVIDDNFSSVVIDENKKTVLQYIFSHLSELESLSREKEWCEHIFRNLRLPNAVSEGDELCFIILAVNDYRKGRVSENE